MTQELRLLSKKVVALADLIRQHSQELEDALKTAVSPRDGRRDPRECKRLQNLMALTAHLYEDPSDFQSMLSSFFEYDPERIGVWESAKYEVLTIVRTVIRIATYVLPPDDAMVGPIKNHYADLVGTIDPKCTLADMVYNLDIEGGRSCSKELVVMGDAYAALMNRMKAIALEMGTVLAEDEKFWFQMTEVKGLQHLGQADSKT